MAKGIKIICRNKGLTKKTPLGVFFEANIPKKLGNLARNCDTSSC